MRAEWRDNEPRIMFLPAALQRLQEDELPGRLLLLEELNQEQHRELNLNAPSSSQLRTGVARDWPDARAVWSVCLLPMKRSQLQ